MPEDAGFDDVRMRGFRERTDLDTVWAWLDAQPGPTGSERIPAAAAGDRVLVQPLHAVHPVPAFARAAMDGWALAGEATFGASTGDPLELRVIGQARPGHPFDGLVGRGEAVRIMTGAPMPAGADAVLRAEDGDERAGRLEVRVPTAPQRHVGPVGEDLAAGALAIPAGRPLRPQDLGMASALGGTHLEVRRRPRVVLVITGDEVLPAGTPPRGARIADANGPMLTALAARDGGEVASCTLVADDPDAIDDALAAPADLVIVTGGSSVGTEDHAPRVLATTGELSFHGMAMRPAAPTGLGRRGAAVVALLPGNPVSCLAAYDLLLARLLRRWTARPAWWPYRPFDGILRTRIVSVLGRWDYVRVRVTDQGVEPIATRGASILSSTTTTDGFVLVPPGLEGHAARTTVHGWLY